MATKITNYQCPSCMGPLHFDSGIGKLKCEYCETEYEVSEIEALYADDDKKAEAAFAAEEKKSKDSDDWDMSDLEHWDGEAGMQAYNCPSCGAELICDCTTAATSCPYCGNPSIVPGQLHGTLQPDYVIPFKLDRNAAVAALKKHYSKKLFLPSSFSSANHLEDVKGVYVPFWLFDSKADADCSYHATRSHIFMQGDWEITRTDHFEIRRSGSVSFERIPVDGSSKMPDDYMDSIEPFDYSELKPFSTAYLPGFMADKYDVDAKASAPRADERCENSAKEVMRGDVGVYDTVMLKSASVRLSKGKVHYALMPVWVLNTKWQDKNYLFTMNGQTGRLIGDLPVSTGKFLAAFAAFSVALALLFSVTGIGNLLAGLLFS